MSDLKICRICLLTECKVYNFNHFQLKPYYEEVMALKVNDKDGLPHYFCYECATMLHKFHKFKEKCYIGQKILKEINWKGGVTYEAIYKVDRVAINLKSSLVILNVSKLVRTYCTEDVVESDTESIKIETGVPEKNNYDNASEESIAAEDYYEPDFDMCDVSKVNNEPSVDNEDTKVDDKSSIDIEDTKVYDEPAIDNNYSIVDAKPIYVDKKLINNVPSPETVFVDIKREIVKVKSEPLRRKRKRSSAKSRKVSSVYAKRQMRKCEMVLKSNNWKKSILTEEEALEVFRAKANDPKYVAAAYKCADCFKGFSKEEMLQRHNVLRHSESLGHLECRFCQKRFKLDCYRRKHMRSHYTKFECLRCGLVCSLENTLLLHDEYHNGLVKKCKFCGEEFKHQSTYYSHMRTHRSDHVCTLCGVSFVSELGLHMHKKVKHCKDVIESPDDDDEPVNTHCDKCNIRFETREAYEEHIFHSAMHTNKDEEIYEDDLTGTRKVLGKKLQAKITSELKVRVRDEPPLEKKRRRKKMKKAHRKPTTCHQCGKHFETQAACMKHHKEDHPRTSFFASGERHICEICGASLAPGSVTMHQNIHSREKMHPCETCGKTFHSTIGLKRHLVTHTGEKPFACNLCDKRFTQSNSMKLHYRTFHLKQPYPKRNRRKKKEDPPEAIEAEKSAESEEESDDSLQEADMELESERRNESDSRKKPGWRLEQAGHETQEGQEENVHYLTLN